MASHDILDSDFRLLHEADAGWGRQSHELRQEPRSPHTGSQNKITFLDVAGVEEAKEELKEIIDFLRDRRNLPAWAARFPRECF